MIKTTLTFIDRVNKKYGLNPNTVLDVGSKDRNKKIGARALFPDSEYIGVDMEKGPNVDMILDAYELGNYFDKDSFDAVLLLHLLEHTAKPWLIMVQVNYVLKKGGILFVAMPTIGYPQHNYPGDYWRITEQGMIEVVMSGYSILDVEAAKSDVHKHPYINCAGVKYGKKNR